MFSQVTVSTGEPGICLALVITKIAFPQVDSLLHIRMVYSVCSLVVPRLEEAILTPVLKKNFKRPSILGQEGHSYSQKHSNLSYDQFGGGLEQSDTAPLLLPPWLEEY